MAIMQKRVEELLKQLAIKYNLPKHVIEEVFLSQYKKVKEEMNSLEFKTLKLPNWGKYIASKQKIETYDYNTKREELNAKRNTKNGGQQESKDNQSTTLEGL